ncbi:hypothetical protein NE237_031324 [Protea cynaroides]|uniref:Uncharacterized protein n=1 Tax=Protea cynaroides TaxID=273540 RepID=A0A9Q0R2E0_9MAGN|nr:hypothetical protein NE237_031324 [Protea cynaroides]
MVVEGVADRQSPRSSQPSSLYQKKKVGTHIAALESQLGQAQVELKKLKDHLASTEPTKTEAQSELKMKVHKPIIPETIQEVHESLPDDLFMDLQPPINRRWEK